MNTVPGATTEHHAPAPAGAKGGAGGGGVLYATAAAHGAAAGVAQLKDALRNGVQVGHIDKLNNMNMCYNSWKRVGLIDMKRAGLVAPARFNYND